MRAWLLGLLLLAGCATKYQPMGFTGGFSEIQLNEDTFEIKVSGNGYTSVGRARDIALLRACDLTLEKGLQRFVVVAGNVASEYGGSMPVTANRIGGSVIVSGGDPIFRPAGNIVIQTVKPSDPRFGGALDARLIGDQLRPRLS